jgi:alkanesulfonate monooxygenase SsuD/methylene tetrahydromethanopterin reductase-like flavin-dependent oxidoreductase (luciferase family)
MKTGIGLPMWIKGTKPEQLLEWARRAEAGPFSSLGTLDRVVYHNYEPLTMFAAVAAITKRIRFTTTVLLATTRNAGILAKQAATIDAISGGRLTLGLGVGGREDDFKAAPEPFHGRGRRFEEQLDEMTRAWRGEPIGDGVGPIGPAPSRPGGPELLIGGYSEAAVRRVGKWANGFISGGRSDPEHVGRFYRLAEQSWKDAGRKGEPRLVGCVYYALGDEVSDQAIDNQRTYYGFTGAGAERMAHNFLSTRQAIKEVLKSFSDLGADELFFWPAVADFNQIERLTEAIA